MALGVLVEVKEVLSPNLYPGFSILGSVARANGKHLRHRVESVRYRILTVSEISVKRNGEGNDLRLQIFRDIITLQAGIILLCVMSFFLELLSWVCGTRDVGSLDNHVVMSKSAPWVWVCVGHADKRSSTHEDTCGTGDGTGFGFDTIDPDLGLSRT